jgi:hypothetical protein
MDKASNVTVTVAVAEAVVETAVVETTVFEYIGVDVSKDTLEVALKYDAKSFTVGNHLAGIAQLLQRLPAVGTCVVVLEGSGGYERDVIAELLQAGHKVRSPDLRETGLTPEPGRRSGLRR